MKTTKKGFTLIELIVVIAIIGVLAAILVPTMLGYVRKSKISSANSAASSVYKGINSALTELDEEGIDVGGLYILNWNGTAWSADTDTDVITNADVLKRFTAKVSNFFADISKVKEGKAALKGGGCIAFAGRTDSTYTGTYPGGVVTTDTYEGYSKKVSVALSDAIAVASGVKATGAKDQAGKLTAAEGDYKTLQGKCSSAG